MKFHDDARVRLRGSGLVSLGGASLGKLELLLREHGLARLDVLFRRDEAAIDATRAKAERRSGRRLPDLNGYVEIAVAPGDSEALLAALRALPIVSAAYRPATAPPPPTDIPPPTPNGEPNQGYLYAAPAGIDAAYAWIRPGGRGQGVRIVDIEYSWRSPHEDLEATVGAAECWTSNTGEYIEHGTASMGLLVAGANGYGVTGIANLATPSFVTSAPLGMGYSVARAIDCAIGFMAPGDVMLLEAQTYGPRGALVPVEWDQAEYDAISIATASGIVVVEAAGNGSEDLDDPVFGNLFSRSYRDSGAIVVGAGAPPDYGTQPDRSRLDFSTYGSRVDVQGWGDDVVTTGYGDAFDGGGDPNQYYTAVYSGTSSASAMVAGAATALAGAQLACNPTPLTPTFLRTLLNGTGSPQVEGPFSGNIGPRPNLRAAIDALALDHDGDGLSACAGDCSDADPTVWAIPGETLNLRFSGDKITLNWDAPASPGATLPLYDTLRSPSRSDFFGTGLCVETGGNDTQTLDAETPSPGSRFYYVVRAKTPCGEGTMGQKSSGEERVGRTCP